MAVAEGVDTMCVLFRDLKEMERSLSPNTHTVVLLMSAQKLLGEMVNHPEMSCPTVPFAIRHAY